MIIACFVRYRMIQILVCQPWSKLGLLLPILGDGNGNTWSIFIRIRIPIERNPIHDGGMILALKYRALTMAHVNLRNMRVCLRHVLKKKSSKCGLMSYDQNWSTMKPRNLLVAAKNEFSVDDFNILAPRWGRPDTGSIEDWPDWLVCFRSVDGLSCWVRINGGGPKHRWFILENPIKMDDFKGYHHFWKPPIDCSTNWRGKGDP